MLKIEGFMPQYLLPVVVEKIADGAKTQAVYDT
jgi:hypothetical protein